MIFRDDDDAVPCLLPMVAKNDIPLLPVCSADLDACSTIRAQTMMRQCQMKIFPRKEKRVNHLVK
jgi:hypothetical protein